MSGGNAMLPKKVETYLLGALAGAPDVFEALVWGMTEEEADRRPDPERFSIREAIAHLADWEDVFRKRLLQTRDEANATLQGYDEGQWAIDHDYARSDWRAQLQLFRAGRAKLVALLRALTPAQWERTAIHTEIGPITMEQQAVLILAHDGYHETQIAQWRHPV
jgi:hypothetical protein